MTTLSTPASSREPRRIRVSTALCRTGISTQSNRCSGPILGDVSDNVGFYVGGLSLWKHVYRACATIQPRLEMDTPKVQVLSQYPPWRGEEVKGVTTALYGFKDQTS